MALKLAVNTDDNNYVAYVWAEIPGYSKFGTFTHTSSSQTHRFGFKPKFWLVKEVDGTTPWYIFDLERDNLDDPLFTHSNGGSSSGWGFTINDDSIDWVSGSFAAGTYIYAAFC